jgi:hypothetical protein
MSDVFNNILAVQGSQGLFGQNPYLKYQGQIPMAGFRGDATNAMGQMVPSWAQALQQAAQPPPATAAPPGTTLNSSPGGVSSAADLAKFSQYGGVDPSAFTQGTGQLAVNPATGQTLAQAIAMSPAGMYSRFMGALPGPQFNGMGGVDSQAANTTNGMLGQLAANQYYGSMQGRQPAAPAAPAPPAGPDMRQAYLDALANPGNPAMPGAAPPGPGQALTGAAQVPSVLQSFLASNAPRTGAGNFTNAPFFKTLQGLQPAPGGAGT